MAELKPFTPRTTETIERANRFLAFRDSPAYNEVFRLSQELVGEARTNQRQFKGWDSQQIVTLAIRVQVAEEFHEQLFGRMAEIVNSGVAEAKSMLGNNREAIAASDKLRDRVMSHMDAGESRVPGSY